MTYAVKANDTSEVIENLHMAGLSTSRASPAENRLVRDLCADATLQLNQAFEPLHQRIGKTDRTLAVNQSDPIYDNFGDENLGPVPNHAVQRLRT